MVIVYFLNYYKFRCVNKAFIQFILNLSSGFVARSANVGKDEVSDNRRLSIVAVSRTPVGNRPFGFLERTSSNTMLRSRPVMLVLALTGALHRTSRILFKHNEVFVYV